jgi:hypothetical protein
MLALVITSHAGSLVWTMGKGLAVGSEKQRMSVVRRVRVRESVLGRRTRYRDYCLRWMSYSVD